MSPTVVICGLLGSIIGLMFTIVALLACILGKMK